MSSIVAILALFLSPKVFTLPGLPISNQLLLRQMVIVLSYEILVHTIDKRLFFSGGDVQVIKK
jgi:hypothetical protein